MTENHVSAEHHTGATVLKQFWPEDLSQHEAESPGNRRQPGAPFKVKRGGDAAGPDHHVLVAAQSGCFPGHRLMGFERRRGQESCAAAEQKRDRLIGQPTAGISTLGRRR